MPGLTPALCVCGLAAEARIAREAGFQVVIGGGDPARTAARLAAAGPGARCLVSFGIAGGLAPGLRPGDVILSTDIVARGRRWQAPPPVADAVARLAGRIGARCGPVFGTAVIIATPEEKQLAWRDSGALVADLESAVVAAAAAAAGIPFVALRTVADPASRTLPPAALVPLAADGRPALRGVAAAVARRPQQIAALLGVALETRRALRALAGAADALGGALAGIGP